MHDTTFNYYILILTRYALFLILFTEFLNRREEKSHILVIADSIGIFNRNKLSINIFTTFLLLLPTCKLPAMSFVSFVLIQKVGLMSNDSKSKHLFVDYL